MQIKRIWISKYKNLKDVTFEFQSDLVSLLIGNNGLGKSNLIEALLQIFIDLKGFENENQMIEWEGDFFQFELHFFNELNEIKISLREFEAGKLEPRFEVRPISADNQYPFIGLSFNEFKKVRTNLLPEHIIGYYSGENKRLHGIAEIYKNQEIKRLLRLARQSNQRVFDESIRSIFITESNHSALILLTVCLFGNRGKEYSHFSKLIKDYIGIESIETFSIRFNNPNWNYEELGSQKINKGVDFILENVQQNIEHPFWNLTGKLDRLITRFYNYDIERGRDPIFYESTDENKKEFEKEILEFSNIDISRFSDELKDIFVEPINFFDALETTVFLDIFKDLTFRIKKEGVDDLIDFAELSEGEQQLLTTIGLLILFSDRQTLFLFDEPDTHLNPTWQRNYVHLIEEFNQMKVNNQLIIATHSPLIVQSAENADLFLFKKNGDEILIDSNDHQIHNWRIDQVLVSEYFDLPSARPKSLDKFMIKRKEILSKEVVSAEDILELQRIENEEGSLPTGETVTDIETMLLLRNALNKLK